MTPSILTLTCAAAVLVAVSAQLCPRAHTAARADLAAGARAVLDGNWVSEMNSTLPSPNLYPHQWSWDASFVAMGYSHYDTGRAIDETDALFRGQWRNGHIPHIVFNPSAVESYFPGPDFWKIDTAAERGPANAYTSGITQPPVHAIASLAIYENAPDAESRALALEHLEDVFPKLTAWHNYLYRERDPFNRNLVFIRHMWESGMDNSPAWDPVLANMNLKEGDVPPYQRVDKGKVGDHKERPDEFFYDRAVHLIKIFYDNNYDEARIAKVSPFLIEDVLFNSILARAGASLARIATILDRPAAEIAAIQDQSDRTATALSEKLYDEKDGYFYDYDLVRKTHIKTRISGGLAGIFGARMSPKQVQRTVEHLYSDGFLGSDLSAWTVASVARDDVGYTNTTYWKGPAWINVNYLIRDGLLRNAGDNADAKKIAKFLMQKSLDLMAKSGFYEYFNPISGSPHGGHQFSWSAALAIDMICGASVDNVTLPTTGTTYTVLYGVAAILAALAVVYAAVYLMNSSAAKDKVEPEPTMAQLDNTDDWAPVTGVKTPVDSNVVRGGNLRLRNTARSGDRHRR